MATETQQHDHHEMPTSDEDVLLLTVVIYRPQDNGNYHHWALDVHTLRTDDHCLFQTEGAPNHLRPAVYSHDPVLEHHVVRRIGIGRLGESQWPHLHEVIKSVKMQNEVSSWDCQEYVLDVMDALEEQALLGSLDKYDAVKRALRSMRGDVESVNHAVTHFDYRLLSTGSNNHHVEADDEEPSEDEEADDTDREAEEPEHRRQYKSEETIVDSDEE